MLILDLWGISFHAVVVFALGKNLLFKSALGHCVDERTFSVASPFPSKAIGRAKAGKGKEPVVKFRKFKKTENTFTLKIGQT